MTILYHNLVIWLYCTTNLSYDYIVSQPCHMTILYHNAVIWLDSAPSGYDYPDIRFFHLTNWTWWGFHLIRILFHHTNSRKFLPELKFGSQCAYDVRRKKQRRRNAVRRQYFHNVQKRYDDRVLSGQHSIKKNLWKVYKREQIFIFSVILPFTINFYSYVYNYKYLYLIR